MKKQSAPIEKWLSSDPDFDVAGFDVEPDWGEIDAEIFRRCGENPREVRNLRMRVLRRYLSALNPLPIGD